MNKEYSEAALQHKVIELFKNMGYKYLSPDEALKERDNNTNNVLLKNILKQQLMKMNSFEYKNEKHDFSLNNIEKAIEDLNVPLDSGYLSANREITEKLLKGESYKEKVGDYEESFNIYYIDFDNIENNVFHITEEFTVKRNSINEKEKTRRPDLIIFINGIPISVIELKKASVNSMNAIEQMVRNQNENEIRQLFKFTQILIAANDDTVKYATAGSSSKFYTVWKDNYDRLNKEESQTKKELKNIIRDRIINNIDITLYSLFEKKRLLDILEFFIIFDGIEKKVTRYNQYFAIKKIMKRIENLNSKDKREGGVIWHTQGSGKSLTMSMLTKIISRKMENSKVIVVTDRISLDEQIHKTFQNTNIGVDKARTGNHLIKLINNNKKVITTVINKFEKAFEGKIQEDSKDIFILVDESHRTQYGDFAESMRKIFPNACYLGFTGTPLYKTEKNTAKKFGGFIDLYTIRDALEDKVIVPLYYESRLIGQKINDEKELDRRYELITSALTNKQKNDLNNKKISEKTILETEKRLMIIADDIAKHYKTNLKNTCFNAMLAVASKYEALKIKEIFDEYYDNNFFNIKTAAVISSQSKEKNEGINSEKKEYVKNKWKDIYSKYTNDENKYVEEIIKKFKDGDIDIINNSS